MSETKAVELSVVHAPVLIGGDDAATAKQLGKLFADAQNGMRRIVALGLFAWEIKETKLKHGQFGPWLAAHCPKLATVNGGGKPTASRALNGYMELTKGVLESVGFKTIGGYLDHISNSQTMRICHGGKFLLLPDKKIPEAVKPLREKICALVDGKTQRALFIEFKQADDEGKVKRGQLKGSKGCTKEDRAAAKQRKREAELLELKLRLKELGKELDDLADDTQAGDPEVGDDLNKLFPKVENFFRYLQTIREARKGK